VGITSGAKSERLKHQKKQHFGVQKSVEKRQKLKTQAKPGLRKKNL
jgi:hypothetical protein